MGYTADPPAAALLRLKTVTVTYKVTDEAAAAPGIYGCAMDTFGLMKPFLQ